MKRNKYVTVFALLNGLALCFAANSTAAGEGKKQTSHRGGQANLHMSEKGATNTNAQWSADPERGWVRAESRYERKGSKSQHNHGKHKDKAAR
jgi:hypothetical protein